MHLLNRFLRIVPFIALADCAATQSHNANDVARDPVRVVPGKDNLSISSFGGRIVCRDHAIKNPVDEDMCICPLGSLITLSREDDALVVRCPTLVP